MAAYTPSGWPAGVHPPGSDDFESTAVGWLLDVVPPDYRLHGVLRRHPLALAAMARHHSKACVEGARQGYRTARTELTGTLPPHAVDSVLAAYRKEGARLAATANAVSLVERALRGEVFAPKMAVPASRPVSPPPEVQPERSGQGRGAPADGRPRVDADVADDAKAPRAQTDNGGKRPPADVADGGKRPRAGVADSGKRPRAEIAGGRKGSQVGT
jgi:hypothetical protein